MSHTVWRDWMTKEVSKLIKIVDLLNVSPFPLQILPVGESEGQTTKHWSKSVIERRIEATSHQQTRYLSTSWSVEICLCISLSCVSIYLDTLPYQTYFSGKLGWSLVCHPAVLLSYLFPSSSSWLHCHPIFFHGNSTSTNSTKGIRQYFIYLFLIYGHILKKLLVYNSKRELEFWSFVWPFILIFPLIFVYIVPLVWYILTPIVELLTLISFLVSWTLFLKTPCIKLIPSSLSML